MATTTTNVVQAHKVWKRDNPLREWRTQQGVTIHEAASILGCSMTSIQLWEAGGARPGEEYMAKLTKLIGTQAERRWDRWLGKNPAKNL